MRYDDNGIVSFSSHHLVTNTARSDCTHILRDQLAVAQLFPDINHVEELLVLVVDEITIGSQPLSMVLVAVERRSVHALLDLAF